MGPLEAYVGPDMQQSTSTSSQTSGSGRGQARGSRWPQKKNSQVPLRTETCARTALVTSMLCMCMCMYRTYVIQAPAHVHVLYTTYCVLCFKGSKYGPHSICAVPLLSSAQGLYLDRQSTQNTRPNTTSVSFSLTSKLHCNPSSCGKTDAKCRNRQC